MGLLYLPSTTIHSNNNNSSSSNNLKLSLVDKRLVSGEAEVSAAPAEALAGSQMVQVEAEGRGDGKPEEGGSARQAVALRLQLRGQAQCP